MYQDFQSNEPVERFLQFLFFLLLSIFTRPPLTEILNSLLLPILFFFPRVRQAEKRNLSPVSWNRKNHLRETPKSSFSREGSPSTGFEIPRTAFSAAARGKQSPIRTRKKRKKKKKNVKQIKGFSVPETWRTSIFPRFITPTHREYIGSKRQTFSANEERS